MSEAHVDNDELDRMASWVKRFMIARFGDANEAGDRDLYHERYGLVFDALHSYLTGEFNPDEDLWLRKA